jgi:hypothetical protein
MKEVSDASWINQAEILSTYAYVISLIVYIQSLEPWENEREHALFSVD